MKLSKHFVQVKVLDDVYAIYNNLIMDVVFVTSEELKSVHNLEFCERDRSLYKAVWRWHRGFHCYKWYGKVNIIGEEIKSYDYLYEMMGGNKNLIKCVREILREESKPEKYIPKCMQFIKDNSS